VNLPTLNSPSKALGGESQKKWGDLGCSAQQLKRSGKENLSCWPTNLYKNLNQQDLMPPWKPGGSLPLPEERKSRKPEWSYPADHVGELVPCLPDLSNKLRTPSYATMKYPERGYQSPGIQLKTWVENRRESSGPIIVFVNKRLYSFPAERRTPFTGCRHGAFSPGFQENSPVSWIDQVRYELEPQLLIRGLKLHLDRDVEKARLLAKWGVDKFPESRDLKKILKLLTPSKVIARTASGISRKDDFEWIRANQSIHRGQWIAISKGKCLASGEDLRSVRERAQKLEDLKNVLITFLPEEKRHATIPEGR
jgi:hypothetical protein